VTVINVDPHPRVLFEDVPEGIYRQMEPLVATARAISHDDKVPENEWDAVVSFHSSPCSRDTRLHLLSFGATYLDMVRRSAQASTALLRNFDTIGEKLAIPDSVDKDMRQLIMSSVVPHLERAGSKKTWGYHDGTGWNAPSVRTGDLKGHCKPLIHVGEEHSVLALERDRPSENVLCWALPSETMSHVEWFKLFLKRLHDLDPARFPSGPDWQTSTAWATPELLSAVDQVEQLEDEKAKLLEDIEKRIAAAQSSLEALQSSAAQGPHQLLTEASDPLVSAVTQALTDIGFDVEEMDETHRADNGALLEDLRVTDPSDPDWISLVEVKGYGSGVKVNDIPSITQRPCTHYAMETGRTPATVWFVANHHRTMQPDQRPKFVGNPDTDLAVLTNVDGAGIDTRDLFHLWRDVVTGEVDQARAVTELKSARGHWSWT